MEVYKITTFGTESDFMLTSDRETAFALACEDSETDSDIHAVWYLLNDDKYVLDGLVRGGIIAKHEGGDFIFYRHTDKGVMYLNYPSGKLSIWSPNAADARKLDRNTIFTTLIALTEKV